MTAGRWNIARYLPQRARETPDKPCVIVQEHFGGFPEWSFARMEARSNAYARGFLGMGLRRGDTAVVMIPPGFEFIAVTFALFKAGIVPVLIDPGMGVANLLNCIDDVRPDAFIAVPRAQVFRVFKRGRFKSVRHVVTVGKRWFWGGKTLASFEVLDGGPLELADVAPEETAAILFTTGSTGPPKGVVYEHGIFNHQVEMIQSYFKIGPSDVDMPAFPLFALFSTAFGIPAVIPDMNPTRPAQCDPETLVRAILEKKVTLSFGSPAIWDRVGTFCAERKLKLPTLNKILMAGAPVSGHIIERMRRALEPEAKIHTPYGATECLPLACIESEEILAATFPATREGAGVCVGRPLPGMEVKIIKIHDEPIEEYSVALLEEEGAIGEIVARGPVATKSYYHRDDCTRAGKMRDREGVWHRMGDVGYIDPVGRLWVCGRLAHRVTTADGTLFTIQCEAVFNEHPDVRRSALVGVGRPGAQTPVIVIEPKEDKFPITEGQREHFMSELLDLAEANALTRPVHTILFYKDFPVDIRHNVKIFREKLAAWAAEQEL